MHISHASQRLSQYIGPVLSKRNDASSILTVFLSVLIMLFDASSIALLIISPTCSSCLSDKSGFWGTMTAGGASVSCFGGSAKSKGFDCCATAMFTEDIAVRSKKAVLCLYITTC